MPLTQAALAPGGRDPLSRKIARRVARQLFPHVTATEAELAVLETALRSGAYEQQIKRHALDGARAGLSASLGARDRQTLRDLGVREHRADPEYARRIREERGFHAFMDAFGDGQSVAAALQTSRRAGLQRIEGTP